MPAPSVLVVGGGVMGASVAFHLTAAGCKDVVVLDRGDRPGAGSTSKATGGFRAQFGTAINVRLSLLAREKLRRFREDTGGDAGYVPAGYLWLASTEREMTLLREAQRMQRAEGLAEAVELSPREIVTANPAVEREGLAGATFCPSDGFLRPMGVLEGYLDAAARRGARFEWGVEALALERGAEGRITGVVTRSGTRGAGAVVNAAGAWAGMLARTCGLDAPVTPLRRQIAVTEPTRVLPETMPMTIFVSDGFHLRVRDGRVLLVWPSPGVPGHPFDTRVEDVWIDAVTAKARARVPILRDVPIDRGRSWAGLYEMSPDQHAILGSAPDCSNLYLINGSSGHGVMHAPALGQLLAEIILDGAATTLDVGPLRPSRFAEGEPNLDSDLL